MPLETHLAFSCLLAMNHTQSILYILIGLILNLFEQVESTSMGSTHKEISEKAMREKRNGIKNSKYHWSGGVIPYDIEMNSFGK